MRPEKKYNLDEDDRRLRVVGRHSKGVQDNELRRRTGATESEKKFPNIIIKEGAVMDYLMLLVIKLVPRDDYSKPCLIFFQPL